MSLSPEDGPGSDSASDGSAVSVGRNVWMFVAFLLSLAFLVPAFMLLRPAAEPSARGAQAARHGFIQLDNEEGALLFQAMQIGRGESIYHSLTEPPYVAGTYTPLFMATVAAVDDFTPPNFTAGRVIVWATALLTGILLVLLVIVATRNAPLGVLAGFLFLATWEVYQWIGYFRVDFPAMFLSVAGLAVIVLGGTRMLTVAAAALLMTLALYTKQTMIAAPIACFVALFFQQPRRAVRFAVWMLVWGLPPLVILEIATGGQFLRHTVLYNMNTWHRETLDVWARHVWRMHQWFFLAGLVALPFGVIRLVVESRRVWRARRDESSDSLPAVAPVLYGFWQPLAWYALLAQWNFMGIAKAGSAENYLLEPLAGWALITCLTAGGALRLMTREMSPLRRAGLAGLCLVILGGTILHGRAVTEPFSYRIRFSPLKNPGKLDFEASAIITARMREAKNPYSELAIYHLQTGKPPVIQPFIMSELARQGKWDQSRFDKALRDGQFDLVVVLDDVTQSIATDSYTGEMLAAFHAAYKVDQVLNTPLWSYYVLVPKTEADAPAISDLVYNQ